MHQRCAFVVMVVVGGIVFPLPAKAQTASYHLHKEASKTSGSLQLKAAAPDAPATTIASTDFKKLTGGEYLVKAFDTAAGVPNAAGIIPVGSVVSFTLWMKKSANAAAMYPRAKLSLNSKNGAALCSATGTNALTTSVIAYELRCATTSAVEMTAADRYYLWVGVNVTTPAGNTGVKAQLSIEGALNGNYDSRIVTPLPGVQPTSGTIGGVVLRASDQAPLAGALVELLRDGDRVAETTITSTGRYTLGLIPAGTYALRVSANEFATVTRGGVAVAAGNTRTEDFALVALGGVTGRITDAATGAPVGGAAITAVGAIAASAVSDIAGAYQIPHLGAGTYALTVHADGYRRASATPVLVADGRETTQNFAIERGSVSYTYDELDRLVAVVNPSGASAVYRYDAAGNILSIARQGADTLSILGFSPASGPAGTVVSIAGTAFGGNASSRSVEFGGVTAAIASASETQIVAIVPIGAPTGPITVDNGTLAASSAKPFTVVADAGVPTITGFAPAVASSGVLVVTGTNFDGQPGHTRVSENSSLMDPLSVRADAVEASLPADATSGHVEVRTPAGAALSAGVLFVPPPFYAPGDVGFTALAAMDHPIPVPVSTSTISLIAFDATAGQRIAVRHSVNAQKVLIGPHRRELAWFWDVSPPVAVPVDGTYTIVEYPCYSQCTTSTELTVVSVAADIDAVVSLDGPPFAFDLTTIGQRTRLAFTARGGEHIFITMTEGTTYLRATLLDARGFDLFGSARYLEPHSSIDVTLSEPGSYSLVVEPDGEFDGGHFSVALREIVDSVVSLDIDGAAATATTTEPEQNIYASFAGTSGTRITLLFSDVTFEYSSWVALRGPDGRTISSQYVGTGSEPSGRLLEYDLPSSGIYTLFVDTAQWGHAGSVTIQAFTRPPDVVAAIAIDDPPLTIALPQRWQKARVSFSGVAGQTVRVVVGVATFAGRVSLETPRGYGFSGAYANPTGAVWFDATLPETGTFAIVVDPADDQTGTIALSITAP